MHPLQILLLQWQGIPLTHKNIWEILSLSDKNLREYFKEHHFKVSDNWFSKTKNDLEVCRLNSLKLIPFWHPHYPADLKLMSRPPLVLCCKGDTSQLVQPSLAVVGSRKMNFQSAKWMEKELAEFFKMNSCLLSSGGAYGVDQKAHQLSILHERPSVCWLPCGLLDIYPTQLKRIIPDILDTSGLLVSTYGPYQKMRKFHFVQRNQFIAASSLLTFIVQAKRKSGTLITARAAADFGKEVAVLPSGPLEEGLGGLDLLYDGAKMVRDAQDLHVLLSELMV